MIIGDPKRTIYVEPLELPEPLREAPSILPEHVEQPQEEPVKVGG